MTGATTRTTQPMALPWCAAHRGEPRRLLITLERRVSLVVEDREHPVADLHARVLAVELLALLTVEDAGGRILEQRRVRAQAPEVARFTETVLEQLEQACHVCPGVDVAVTRDDSAIWHSLRQGLAGLSIRGARVAIAEVADRPQLTSEDLELTRRARRRALGTPLMPSRVR